MNPINKFSNPNYTSYQNYQYQYSKLQDNSAHKYLQNAQQNDPYTKGNYLS